MWLIKGLGLGGAEKLLADSLPYLDRERFEYEICYMLPGKVALVPPFMESGVPVHCLGMTSRYDPMPAFRLVQLLRERRPDVLHTHSPFAGILGGLATRAAKVPAIVYTEHSAQDSYNGLTLRAHRATFRRHHQVICISDAVRESIPAPFRSNGRPRVRTILNGMDWDAIRQKAACAGNPFAGLGVPAGNQVVVTVAYFRPEKGHDDLLRAAVQVLKERPGTTFVLVGTGPLLPVVRKQAADLGIDGAVRFTGSRSDAVSFIASCDLYVLPSYREGFGLTLVEALALCRPIVACEVDGVPEVVRDGIDGLLVRPRDPARLAQAILAVHSDSALQLKFRESPKAPQEERLSIRRMVREVESVYQEALENR
jgi:glycosyltransferase involved in cell wall biosynthesis